MTLVQLTEITHGDPRPFAVNPDHVMSLRPRKTLAPLDTQQGDPRMTVGYNGTIITLATGDQHFVTEDFNAVHQMVEGARDPAPPEHEPPTPKASEQPISPEAIAALSTTAKTPPKKSAQKPEPDQPSMTKMDLTPSTE